MTAALGVACGVGMYLVAVIVTSLALLSLMLLKRVEDRLSRDTYINLRVLSDDLDGQMARIEGVIAGCGLQLVNISLERDLEKREILYEYAIKLSTRERACRVVDDLAAINGIKKIQIG